MKSTRTVWTRVLSSVVASAATILITVTFAGTASAQNAPAADVRWQAWLGCWIPEVRGAAATATATSASEVCVFPAPGVSAVDIVTVTDGRIVSRDRVEADGVRRDTVSDGCERSEQAAWSADERRVYLRSEYQCPGGVKRSSTGLFGLSPTGAWLDVSSVTIGDNTGVRVLRYAPAPDLAPALPAEIVASLQGQMSAIDLVRTAAASPVDTADIAEVSQHVSTAVIQTWLAELGQKFTVTADTLVALARDSIPDPAIDVIVALAYPRVFSLEASDITMRPTAPASGDATAVADAASRAELRCVSTSSEPNPVLARARCLSGYRNYNSSWYDSFGHYPYGYGTWYLGSVPIVVVTVPSSPSDPAAAGGGHGQVVNGRGYAQGRTDAPAPASGSGTGSASSSTPSSTSSPPDSSPAPSSAGDGDRTAHPR